MMTSILEAFVPVLGVLGKSDSCDRPKNLQLLADEFKPSTVLSLKSTSVRQPREGADTTKTPVIKQTVRSSTNYVDNVKSKNNVFGGQQIVLDIPSSLSLKEKQKLREKIVDNGGQLSYILTNKSHIVIHIQDSSQKNLVGEKLNKALKYNIPVVTEDFIDACLQANRVVDPQPFLFIKKAQGEAFHRGKITVNPTKPIRNKTFKPLLLNSLSVYPYEGLDGYDFVKGTVLKGNHKIQHLQAVVKMGDSSHDTPKNQVVLFLVIELHVSFGHDKDSKQQYCIFTHQGNLLKLESSVRECRYVESPEMALSVYTQLYNKATSSPFFMKRCTHLLHADLGSPAFQKLQSEWSKTAVNVSPEVLGLVEFLWTEAMGHLTTFLSVPPAKIPQWKIDEAEGILSQLENLLKEQNMKDLMVRLSQEFYSVLPHHPQHQCPILDKKVLLQKQDLCQVLRDMASVSETTGWMTEGQQYAKYQALRCHITYLHESTEEYERIKGHILESQKRDTGIQVHNIFCVQRDIETAEFFYHLSNHKELYHATRSENLVGILSRGLLPPVSVQTEPDENQMDVGMLGAGIYFADSASTCIKYSNLCKERGTRFLLVCKVALGKIFETYMFDTTLTSPPEGFDSVQGVGNSEIGKSYFMDNEFVVYDKNHQQLCYLVEFSIPEEQSLISVDLSFYRCDVKDTFLCKLPFDEKEIFEYNTNIDDVSNVEDPLTKVTVGLQMLDSSGQQLSLPLQAVHVRAQMFDLVSQVVVFQVYKNPHKKLVEAKYVFPLEAGSAVCGFEAYINNKHVVGKVKKKEKAHEEYKEAIKKGHGGYLMDQETPDIFTVSVGNLPPNCTAIIKITYVTEIAIEGDLICFSVPSSVASGIKDSALQHTTQTTTETVDIENLHGKFSLQMCIEMPFLIRTIQSPTHRIKIKKTETKAVVAVEECNMLNVDFNLLIGLAEVHVPRMWVERHPEEESQACMLTFYPEFEAPELQQPEIVLCIDASNSMKGAPFQDALKVALLCLNHLPEKSLFNLVAFGSVFQELFPSSQSFTSKIKKEAEEFLKHLTPNLGNTELFRPLRSYYLMTKSDELVNMLVITDGFVNNEGSVISAARKSCSKVRVFTMGVSSTVNKHFLKRVSHHGAGCFEFFDPSHKSKWIKKIKAQLQKAVQPVLTNVCVEWKLFDEDAPLPLQAPRQIMSLFSGNRQIVYGFVSHCHMAILKAEVCGEEISTVVSTSELSETVGLVLHKLTARSVIYDWEEGLLDENRIKQLTKKREQEEEIVGMSTKFGIVCSLTSFVAIEERSEEEDIYGHEPPLDELLLSEDVDILPYIGYEEDNSHLGILCTTSTTLESSTGDQEELQRNFNMESDADSSDDLGFGYIDLYNDDTDVRFNEFNSPPALNIEKLICVKNFEDKLVMDKSSSEDKVDGVDVEAKQVQSHSEITRKLVSNVKHFQNSTLTDHQDVKCLNEEFVLVPAKDVLPFKAKKPKTMASIPTVSLNRLELKEKLTSNPLVPSSTLLFECIDETMEKNASLTNKKTDIRLSADRICESLSQSPETKSSSSSDEFEKSDLDSLSTPKDITTQAESTSSDLIQNKLESDKANTILSSATLYEAPVAEIVSTPPHMKMKSRHGMVKKMAAPPPPPPFTLAQSASSFPSIQPLQRIKVGYAAGPQPTAPLLQQITPGYLEDEQMTLSLSKSGTCGFSDSSFPVSSDHLSIVTSSTDIFGGVQSTVPIFSFRNAVYPASSDHQSVVTSSTGIFGGVQSTVPSSTFSFGNTVFSASSDNQSIVTSSTGIFGGVQSTAPTFSFGNTVYTASSDHQSKETSGTGIFEGKYSFPTGLQSTTTSSTFSFGNKTFSFPSDDQSTVMVDKTMSGNASVSFPTTLFSAEQNFHDFWGKKKNTEDNTFSFCNLNMSEQSQNTSKQTSKKKNLKFKCVAPKHRFLSSKIKQVEVDNSVLYVSKYQKNNEELIHQESDRYVEEITCLIPQALSDISNFKGGGVPFTSTVLKYLYKLSSDNLQLEQVLKHIEHDLSLEDTKGEESFANEKGRINEGGQFIMDLRLCQKKQGYWNEEDCIQLHILKNSMMSELESEGIRSLGTKVSVSILRLLSSLAVLSYLVVHNRLLQETLKKALQQPMTVEILEELSEKCAVVLIKNFPVSLWLIKAVVYICEQDKSYSWVCSSLGCRQSWEKFILKYIDLSKTFHTTLMWEHV